MGKNITSQKIKKEYWEDVDNFPVNIPQALYTYHSDTANELKKERSDLALRIMVYTYICAKTTNDNTWRFTLDDIAKYCGYEAAGHATKIYDKIKDIIIKWTRMEFFEPTDMSLDLSKITKLQFVEMRHHRDKLIFVRPDDEELEPDERFFAPCKLGEIVKILDSTKFAQNDTRAGMPLMLYVALKARYHSQQTNIIYASKDSFAKYLGLDKYNHAVGDAMDFLIGIKLLYKSEQYYQKIGEKLFKPAKRVYVFNKEDLAKVRDILSEKLYNMQKLFSYQEVMEIEGSKIVYGAIEQETEDV